MPLDFNVEAIEAVEVDGPDQLNQCALMSPFVWREPDGRYAMLLRAVPPDDAVTGRIWGGRSDDGRRFTMFDVPSIEPGPGKEDRGGVEDPTVTLDGDGIYTVYYTALAADQTHGSLHYAQGNAIDRLEKRGVALASTRTMGNTKEATIDRTADGEYRLFYEYAVGDASRVGVAIGPGLAGPWQERHRPFLPRADSWDNWHLSTGPILRDDPDRPVMFYNGATRDARWRIGWVAFSRDCMKTVDRCIEPLVVPPPVDDRTATDIAFAASVVANDDSIWLYYSLEDRRLARARIRRYQD